MLSGVAGEWLIDEVAIERMVVRVTARAVAEPSGARPADPGRPVAQPDVVAERSRLVLLDLADWPGVAGPSLQLAVASPSGAYRPVPLELAVGGTLSASASAAREAIVGTVDTMLGAASTDLIDRRSSVEVTLANVDHWLESRDDMALAGGGRRRAPGARGKRAKLRRPHFLRAETTK